MVGWFGWLLCLLAARTVMGKHSVAKRGDVEKSHASMCVKFLLFGREKSQENHENHCSSFEHL